MRLFRKYGGDTAVNVTSEGSTLDVTASRRGQTLYLHVVNTDLQSATNAELFCDRDHPQLCLGSSNCA